MLFTARATRLQARLCVCETCSESAGAGYDGFLTSSFCCSSSCCCLLTFFQHTKRRSPLCTTFFSSHWSSKFLFFFTYCKLTKINGIPRFYQPRLRRRWDHTEVRSSSSRAPFIRSPAILVGGETRVITRRRR